MSELTITQTNGIISVEEQTKAWELMQRKAQAYSQSSLVPSQYRNQIEKKDGYNTVLTENPSGLANCIIAIDMAQRMRANELMVMQNLSIIQGRPSWSSQWIIAMINGCGRFSPLRFEVQNLGEKEVDYVEYTWQDKKQFPVQKKIKINNYSCKAWATEKETGERLESSEITIEMAVKEGWYTKAGSKWQTMPEVMLRYRAASFFGKIYAPELLMGLQSVEESQDVVDLSNKYPDAIQTEPAITTEGRPETFSAAQSEPEEKKPRKRRADDSEPKESTNIVADTGNVSEINPDLVHQADEFFGNADK